MVGDVKYNVIWDVVIMSNVVF